MQGEIKTLFVAKHRLRIEVLYYCPACESINEFLSEHRLNDLRCRDCKASLTAESAVLELTNQSISEE